MPVIQKLLPEIVSQIAAGQVVDRPASVIKELLENALDAASTQIDISLVNGGRDMISVSDNGAGMHEEDLLVSFLSHTTSKIFSSEDLHSIKTFGFRGEALASMAAVSWLSIESRPLAATSGMRVLINEGQLREQRPLGMPVGTRVVVEELFGTVPARRKFLKSIQLEFKHCLREVVHSALAHPRVAYRLTHNNSVVLDVPISTHKERITQLLGEDLSGHLVPFDLEDTHVDIQGFIGRPQIATPNNKHQYIFVNQRAVGLSALSMVFKETYASLLEPRALPSFLIFMNLPPETVDVNIHPRKQEVSIIHLDQIVAGVREKTKELLTGKDIGYRLHNQSPVWELHDSGMVDSTAKELRKLTSPWQVREYKKTEDIAQLHNLYLVTETNKGVLLIDQHAAHERILYEQFLESFRKMTVEQVDIEKSVVWHVAFEDAQLIHEQIASLQTIGFDIEQANETTFVITRVPRVFQDRDIRTLLGEVLECLNTEIQLETFAELPLDTLTHRTIAYLACRGAIKSGDPLDPEERRRLLEKLAETKTNYTCPHGRPVQLEISLPELEKMFKRR